MLTICKDFKALCGERLGCGVERTVYQHKEDENLVVKVEHTCGPNRTRVFSNISEYLFWRSCENTPLAKNLARVHAISNNGRYLIQDKVEGIDSFELGHDSKFRRLIGDIHSGNHGGTARNPIFVDYTQITYHKSIEALKLC